MIERRPEEAATTTWDLVVIGGGIHGACLTLEAARRGLATLLLERDDFGGATSWNSLRILHGGLRYLQTLDLGRYRESVAERRWFLRHFPDQASVLPCLMPLYGRGLRRPSVFALAMALDDLLARDRNAGVDPRLRLERGRILSPEATRELCPALPEPALRGAALWNDAFMPHAPRVLIEILRWAASCGAGALNYFEATGLATESGRVTGVTATDRENGRGYEFRASRVANCAGPWCREVSGRLDRELPELFHPTLAFNLLLDRELPTDVALAVSSPAGDRSYFLVPWKNRLMAGTHHSAWSSDSEAPEPGSPVVREFLAELAAAAPGLDLASARILRVLSGRLPARAEGDAAAAVRPVIRRHADHGGPAGLVSASGVKYTTARALAEATLLTLCDGDVPPLGGTARPEPAAWPIRTELERADAGDAALADRLRRLASAESVVHLEDLLLRRTDLGLDPEAGERVARKVDSLLAAAQTEELER